MNYYDLILALIPLAFVGFTGALAVGGLALTSAVTLGAAVSVGMVGHALFVKAPVTVPTVPDPGA